MFCNTIMVTSFKGGVGKSTVAANLALGLAMDRRKTLLVDCDFRMRSLDILLGLESEIVNDISDVIDGKIPLDYALITDRRDPDLMFLPAPFNYGKTVDRTAFSQILDEARKRYFLDYIILDTPGTSGDNFSLFASCSDTAYVVATHTFPSLRAAECTGDELEKMGVGDRRLIINMFDMTGKSSRNTPSVVDIIDQTHLRLAGIVPYDQRIAFMQDRGELLDTVRNSNVSKAFWNICKRAEGKNVPLFTGFRGINKKNLLQNR